MKYNKKINVFKVIDIVFFVYALIGIIALSPFFLNDNFGLDIPKQIEKLFSMVITGYFASLYGAPIIYCAFCLCNNYDKPYKDLIKGKYIILNILDAALAYVSLVFYPWPLSFMIYSENKWYYYTIGLVFSFFPLVIEYVHKKKIENPQIFRILGRLFMVIIIGYLCFIISSCGSGIAG